MEMIDLILIDFCILKEDLEFRWVGSLLAFREVDLEGYL